MAAPTDLHDVLTDSWCLTLTSTPVVRTLEIFGARSAGHAGMALDEAWGHTSADGTLLLARVLPGGTDTLIVDLDADSDLPGAQPTVVEALAASGWACTAWSHPNREEVICRTSTSQLAVFDPVTGRLDGPGAPWAHQVLERVGLRTGSEGRRAEAATKVLTPGQKTALAVSALCGLDPDEDWFEGTFTPALHRAQ